jgi:hypothetical protein
MWAVHLRYWLRRVNVGIGNAVVTIEVEYETERQALIGQLLELPGQSIAQYEAFKTGEFFAYGIKIKLKARE